MAGESDLGEVVANLVDDVAVMKRELLNSRWEAVAANFTQIDSNFREIDRRLKAIEDAIARDD